MKEVTIEEIEKVMDEKVRPELAMHGGNIQIEDYEGGTLSVRLLGECCGCPSAGSTMEEIVEEEVKKEIPQVREIHLITGVSDSLIEEARAIMKRRHKGVK